MEKMFSSSPQDPEVVNDPPPPYVLPGEFVDAGIKEDELQILRDYDTVIIVDDSGSMEPLWTQVRGPAPPIEPIADSRRLLLTRHAGHCRHSQWSPPNMTRTVLISISSTTTRRESVSR